MSVGIQPGLGLNASSLAATAKKSLAWHDRIVHIQMTQQAPDGRRFTEAEIAAKVGTMIPVFDAAVNLDEALCVSAYVSENDGSAWYTIDVPPSAVNLRRG